MSTLKKQQLHTIPSVNSKTVGYVGVIIVLFAIIMLGFNSGKNSPASVIVPPASSENTVVPSVSVDTDKDTNPAVDNSEPEDSDAPYPCPDPEQIRNEESGECHDKNKPDEEVGPVGDPTGYEGVKGYLSYISHYHEYYEANYLKGSEIWDNIEGHSLYVEVIEIKKGKFLIFDVIYFDDNKIKHIVKTFKSEKAAEVDSYPKGNKVYDYVGNFHYPESQPNSGIYNDPENSFGGKGYGGFFTVIENTPYGFGIEGSLYVYPKIGSPHFFGEEIVRSTRNYISYEPDLPRY